ncbi:MAG TPA: hypothetical protein V6C99_05380 [Oculatellaceae cyanobacterium]|jgi:hypothetical protein
MTIPEHYRTVFRIYLRFAVIMLFMGLLTGILFQESAKKTPYSDILPAGVRLETVLYLALLHGHAFLIGVVIPLVTTWMLYLGLALGYAPVGRRPLVIGSWLYLPASVVVIALMIYKGYHFQLGVRNNNLDFRALHESLFFGNHALRAAVYGLTHTSMAVGLGTIAVSFWRSIKKD